MKTYTNQLKERDGDKERRYPSTGNMNRTLSMLVNGAPSMKLTQKLRQQIM